MNKLALQGVQDFALTTDALAFMQAAFESFEQLGNLGGDNIIVSGCVVTGSSVSSGWVFLKGKLMPFVGGSVQTNVRIVQAVQTVSVDVASRQQTTYYAEFGTSADADKNVAWSTIKTVETNTLLSSRISAIQERLDLLEEGANTVSLSPSAGYLLPDSSYYLKMRVYRKVVSLFGKVRANNPTDPYIVNIPESYRPESLMPTPMYLGAGGQAVGYVSGSNGVVTIAAIVTFDDITFGTTWVIQ